MGKFADDSWFWMRYAIFIRRTVSIFQISYEKQWIDPINTAHFPLSEKKNSPKTDLPKTSRTAMINLSIHIHLFSCMSQTTLMSDPKISAVNTHNLKNSTRPKNLWYALNTQIYKHTHTHTVTWIILSMWRTGPVAAS